MPDCVILFTPAVLRESLARNLLRKEREPGERKEMNALRAVMTMRQNFKEDIPAAELLRQTPLDRLEETVKTLRKQRTVAEVRKAMVDRIARAPLAEFETLKAIYLRYCGDERE